MSLKSVFIGCFTALLGVATTGCATTSPTPTKENTTSVADKLPDYTVTDPKTGCRSFKDPKNPDARQPCIITEFPNPSVK